MEGITSEAASLAGHLKLGKLIYLYDDNHISIEGDTSITFTESVEDRFKAYGWHVERVADGNDMVAIADAITKAQLETEQPSLIMVRTHIGFGSPKQDSPSAHGEPLGEEGLKATKEHFHWPLEPRFFVPDEAYSHFRKVLDRGAKWEEDWKNLVGITAKNTALSQNDLERQIRGELPPGWDADIPAFDSKDGGVATRAASGKVLNAIAKRVPNLLGGSADLAPSTKTLIAGSGDQDYTDQGGRNLRFGVREHGMAAVVNGMACTVESSLTERPSSFSRLHATVFARGCAHGRAFHFRAHP